MRLVKALGIQGGPISENADLHPPAFSLVSSLRVGFAQPFASNNFCPGIRTVLKLDSSFILTSPYDKDISKTLRDPNVDSHVVTDQHSRTG